MTTTKHLPRIVIFAATAFLALTGPTRSLGDDSLRVIPNGDVGIGTNTPAAPLHVVRSATADDMLQLTNGGLVQLNLEDTTGASW